MNRLRKEILDIKEKRITTIEDISTTNENEKAKQRDSATYIENLQADCQRQGEQNCRSIRKILGNTQHKITKLESTCSQEIAEVSQSAKDITALQINLKEKDKRIDQLKTAGSKLKLLLSSEQKKSKDLEADNASMSTEIKALKAHFQKLDSFALQSSDIDEGFV